MTNLYRNIKDIRLTNKMSQQELAEKAGYTDRSSIAKIEKGEIDLSQSKIIALAKALNTTPAHLMGLDNESSIPEKALRINVYGRIPAGMPLEAVEDIIDWEEIPIEWTRGGKEYIALEVQGDSMYPKYLDKDIVIILLQSDCETGDDCACYVNGYDTTLKTIIKGKNEITLKPINPNYPPKTYRHPGEVEIVGKVVELRRKI